MIETILVTGGTGFVGKGLVNLLLQKGYHVNLLVRREESGFENPNLKTFKWNVWEGKIDRHCIEKADAIIHLAGEEIAGKRWTDERKKQIIESRTKSIRLIYSLLRKNKNQVRHIISASAVGYYGDRGNELLSEDSLPAKDFLAETCIEWEEAVDESRRFGLRIVKLRSGIVLGEHGGVLPQMNRFLPFGLSLIPGSGNQWVSWVHFQDALNIYLYALENENMEGVYNMVSPEPVTLEDMTRCIIKAKKISPLLINVPEFALKIAIGEMSLMVLESTRVSNEKLRKTGCKFKYPTINQAMEDIYSNR